MFSKLSDVLLTFDYEYAIANQWSICLGVNILIPLSVLIGLNNISFKSMKLLLGEALYYKSEIIHSREIYW